MTSEKNHQDRRPGKKNKYKQRLFIGEGDFSYTEAFINKHPQLARAIVATELKEAPAWHVEPEIMKRRAERIDSLRDKGVRILFGVDATQLHINPLLKGEKYKRIHWNCPWRAFTEEERELCVQMIADFFYSCEKIQSKGDRVHITIMQGIEEEEWRDRRQYKQNLVKGSMQAGYKLIRKRCFGTDRYPGYTHRRGVNLEKLNDPGVHREFVFEKDPLLSIIVNSVPLKLSNDKKTYRIELNRKNVASKFTPDLRDCYFVCSTDDDSSDYCSSDDE